MRKARRKLCFASSSAARVQGAARGRLARRLACRVRRAIISLQSAARRARAYAVCLWLVAERARRHGRDGAVALLLRAQGRQARRSAPYGARGAAAASAFLRAVGRAGNAALLRARVCVQRAGRAERGDGARSAPRPKVWVLIATKLVARSMNCSRATCSYWKLKLKPMAKE